MLHEKYKPKNAKDAIGLNTAYQAVKDWVGSWKRSDNNDFLIIHGPSGCGKNLMVDFAADELKLEKIDVTDAASTEQTRQRSLLHSGKIIVIDEPSSSKGLTDVIKKSGFPVIILTSNLYNQRLQPLRQKATKIEIRKPRCDSVAKLLKNISEKEHMTVSDEMIGHISRGCNGDIRASLNDLQSITGSKLEEMNFGIRDIDENVFNTLNVIFHSYDIETVKRAVKNCDKPIDELYWWIENNIFRSYSPSEAADAYEYLALADLYRTYMRKRQATAMMKYTMVLAVLGVSFSKRPTIGRIYSGFTRYTPPTARTKSKKNDIVLNKIAVSMHTTAKKAQAYMPLIKGMKGGAMDAFGLNKEELGMLE